MGLFNRNKDSSGGLSRKERKERDRIVEEAFKEKMKRRENSDEIDPEDWGKAEDGWRPDNW